MYYTVRTALSSPAPEENKNEKIMPLWKQLVLIAIGLAGIVIGGLCLLVYRKLFKNDGVLKFQGDAIELTTGQKIGKFLTSPLMIVAIVVYLLQSLLTLTTQK